MSKKKHIYCTNCKARSIESKDFNSPIYGMFEIINYARFFFITPFGLKALCTGCYNEMFTSHTINNAWKTFPMLSKEEYLVAEVMQS